MPPAPRRRVLIVDDDPLVAETITAMVEDRFDPTTVTAAAEAIAALEVAPRPDAMLVDCLLPGRNLPALLAEADRLGIPAILISGDPREADRAGPGRNFLAKPFHQATLLELLDLVIG